MTATRSGYVVTSVGGLAAGVTAGTAVALRRAAASADEVASVLSGDRLVPGATVTMNRATDFDVPPEVLWPWIAQLGKGRGGWYFPRWLDALTPPSRRSLRRVEPSLSAPRLGDEHPDWGPGDAVLRVTEIEPGRNLLYLSLRDTSAGYRWPADDDPTRPDVVAMTWQLVLTPTPAGTRLHHRVRVRTRTRTVAHLADVFDGITVVWLFAGLRERLQR